MNRTSKRNAIVSALLVIALCVSLMAGATFALFTSESTVNIAVTSGKVSVVATLQDPVATHPVSTSNPESVATGFLRGTAEIVDNKLNLSGMVPGDKVTFKIVITNYSTVPVQYKTTYTQEGDAELLSALNISCGSSTTWLPLGAAVEGEPPVKVIDCSVELPVDAGNTVQEKSCTLSFTVNAVQGNAETATISDPASINASTVGDVTVNENGDVQAIIPAGLATSLAEDVDEVSLAYTKPQIDADAKTITFDSVDLVDGNGNIIDLSKYTSSDKKIKITLPVDTTVLPNDTVVTIYHDGEVIATAIVTGGKVSYDTEHLCKIDIKVHVDTWDGETSTAPSKDKDSNVYHITSAAELYQYITELNNDPNTREHRYDMADVVLDCDIDLGGAVIEVSGEGYLFSGSFDGQNHTVSNFKVKRTDGEYYTGLFSVYLGNSDSGIGEIRNLTVENGIVISDGSQVGAVVASVNTGNTVENCKAYNCIVSGKDQVGSVVGYVCDGVVKDCYAENCTVLYSEGTHQTNKEYPNGNGNGNNKGEVVGFINTIDGKEDLTSNNTCKDVTVGKGTYIADGVVQDGKTYLISNANGLVYCATTFTRSDNTINKVFKLTTDIDMTGIEWTPWCNEAQYFSGLFDGQGHTIKNLTINDTHTAYDGHAVGFIGRLGENANGEKIIKNVTFDNANVSGHHYVGVAVGYNEFGKVDNVKVTNSKVTATHVEGADSCGDKAGALIGFCGSNPSYISVTNCSATNCEVKAARHAAQLIGYGYTGATYTDLTATNVTVSAIENSGCDHRDAGVVSANALIGNGTTDGLTLS